MKTLYSVILAAGKGKRMKADIPKVLFKIDGISLVEHVLRSVFPLGGIKTIVVVGYKADLVKCALENYDVTFAFQTEQLGTADALKSALPYINDTQSDILVLCGDTPFIKTSTLENLLRHHRYSNAHLTILTGTVSNPSGYGRIVRDKDGNVTGIVEEKDATPKEKLINEINSGIYVFDCQKLLETIGLVDNKNAQGEFYLTDLARIFIKTGLNVETMSVSDTFEIAGINSQEELLAAEKEYLRRKNDKT